MSSFKIQAIRKDENNMFIKRIPDIVKYHSNTQPIYLIQQYFVSDNKERQNELKYCLRMNVEQKLFTRVILLNEKIYTKEELGLDDMGNVIQVNINRRMMFSDVFMVVKKMKLNGYIVFANSDIFYDNTIKRLFYSSMIDKPIVQCLAKYDIQETHNNKFKYKRHHNITGSQDSWIIHSKFIPKDSILGLFSFNFGIWECDNRLMYLFDKYNYLVKNEYERYKAYHYHKTQHKTYEKKSNFNKIKYFN